MRARDLALRASVIGGLVIVVAASAAVMRLATFDAPAVQEAAAVAPLTLPTMTTLPAADPTNRVDPVWADAIGSVTGIPSRAVVAYASADLTVAAESPQCGLGWNTVAAIGAIESLHATIGGSRLDAGGYPVPSIRGPALDGGEFWAIADTDGGVWDGDASWDRAVGPMQFIPSTWADWAADGNGDGATDPNQIDDAALATARYLCASGNLTSPQGWRDAVFSYNHLQSYVDDVAAMANRYATETATQ